MRPAFSLSLSSSLACLLCLMLSGCSLSSTSAPTPEAGLAIQGRVMGGQQAIANAHVYLFAANASGNAGPGIAASPSNLSESLLNPTITGLSDSVGAYVLTNSTGGFSITGDYSCNPNTQVYLYALGGSSISTTNSASGLLAALGNCPSGSSFPSSLFISINEVSTIAAAYSFAGYATDATHVSSSGTALAFIGIANAFKNSANLAGISTGVALATTSAGNGTVPQSEINTLANILAACINSSGPSFAACSTLFSNAESAGSSGTAPTDTATAAINIAHNPGANIAALYALSTATPPFAPALSGKPNDFTIALNFTGGGLSSPIGIAIDRSGDAWAANSGIADSVSELSSAGVAISPSTGFTGGGLDFPQAVAIDGSGNAWVTNERSSAGVNGGNGSVTELSSSGTPTSGSPYTGGGLNVPAGLAIDGSGNAWVADNNADAVSKFNSGGTAQSGAGGYTGGGLGAPYDIAIDGSGDAWAINSATNSVSKLSNSGTPISSSSGYTGGGINTSFAIALDGSGDAWVTNAYGNSISKFAHGGGAISPSSGYTGGGLNGPYGGIAIDGAGSVWAANLYGGNGSVTELSSSGSAISPSTGYLGGSLNGSNGIAIDGSGDVWVTEDGGVGGVAEFIGAATPVITPIMAGLPTTPTSNGTSNLGTRP